MGEYLFLKKITCWLRLNLGTCKLNDYPLSSHKRYDKCHHLTNTVDILPTRCTFLLILRRKISLKTNSVTIQIGFVFITSNAGYRVIKRMNLRNSWV